MRAEDLSPAFGTRDKFVAASFESWSNRVRGSRMPTDGALTPELVDGLRIWAEEKASGAVAVAPPPVATQSPGIPQLPAFTPSVPIAAAAPTQLPDGTIVFAGDTITAKPPEQMTGQNGGNPILPPAPKKADNALFAVVGGAGLGFAVGGPVGALIGGAAGAIATA